MHIFVLGYPGNMGGANTECWHTAQVWRAHGIDVTFVPTWQPDRIAKPQLDAIGCKTIVTESVNTLAQVPGLAGSVVVSMCNSHAWVARKVLKELGCKLVWVNCMTFLFNNERFQSKQYGPAEAYIFQSEHQRSILEQQLMPLGYNQGMGHLIRGAFAFDEIPYAPRPHSPHQEFWIGRLARPDEDKWSPNHWKILGAVPYPARRGLAMGWNNALDRKCGPKPLWAETLPPQQIPARDFLARCHAMVGLNGTAGENWPRIGLEAMAAGVPLVCQNQWGWKEMITDGETGFLTNTDEEMAFRLAQLAYDEDLRRAIVERAAAAVRGLACPERIAKQWTRLFTSLGA